MVTVTVGTERRSIDNNEFSIKASGVTGIDRYKGYAFAIAPVWLSYLDNIARDYVNSLEKSILWQNDPNARRIPFTDVEQVSIPNYRANLVDENGVTFNPYEDYGLDAKFEVWQKTSNTTYSRLK